eukprot:7829488-Pyramimonas_sp.AAC.1
MKICSRGGGCDPQEGVDKGDHSIVHSATPRRRERKRPLDVDAGPRRPDPHQLEGIKGRQPMRAERQELSE